MMSIFDSFQGEILLHFGVPFDTPNLKSRKSTQKHSVQKAV